VSRRSKKLKRAAKRKRQRRQRLDRVIKHFTQCAENAAQPGAWIHDDNGMRVQFYCRSCRLKYWRWNELGQIELRGMGFIPEDPTVLDLMLLKPAVA
jgi:hypothetical protein